MSTKRHRFPTELQDELSIYCHSLRVQHKMRIPHIGRLINRHHSTVIHHLKRYEALIAYDRQFQARARDFNEEAFAQKLLKYGIEPYNTLIINI